MALVALSNTSDWELQFEDTQDVRGFRVLDQDGSDTGATVTDMIVDTDAERVSMIEVSDGKQYPAADISIGDGAIYVTGDYHVNEDGPTFTRYSEMEGYGTVRRRTT